MSVTSLRSFSFSLPVHGPKRGLLQKLCDLYWKPRGSPEDCLWLCHPALSTCVYNCRQKNKRPCACSGSWLPVMPQGSCLVFCFWRAWGGGCDYNSAPCWSKANKSEGKHHKRKVVVVVNGDSILVQNHLWLHEEGGVWNGSERRGN